MNIEKLRAARVGVIRFKAFFLTQAEHKVAVHGAEAQRVNLRQCFRVRTVLQNPRHFRGAEIRRKRDTGFHAHKPRVFVECVADVLCAGALPHDGAPHRPPRRSVPCRNGLALVADADRRDLLCLYAGHV